MSKVLAVRNAVYRGAADSDPVLVLGPFAGRGVLVEVGWRFLSVEDAVPAGSQSIEVALVLSGSAAGALGDVEHGRSLIHRGGALKVQGQVAYLDYASRLGSGPTVFPFLEELASDPSFVLVAIEGAASDVISLFAWAVVREK